MCGIAGFFSADSVYQPASIVSRMLDAIEHRGPDGRGEASFANCNLGHVRLAIIDIEGGIQPMSTPDKRFWISYNGELYNFLEIKEGLVKAGVDFQTHSDTEVVLNAFKNSGPECLKQFRGMFAFALWDDESKEGFLVRDSMGIKPLFFTNHDDQLVFGSEIKALLQFPGARKSLDLQSLHLMMNYRYIPGEKTLFHNIFHLMPGHFLHWKEGRFTVKKWDKKSSDNSHLSVESIRSSLKKAIQRQLVSDVPLGSYLSAGIDSATILALSLKGGDTASHNFPTFTIQTGDSPLEHIHAAETAGIMQVTNYQGEVENNLEQHLANVIWHLEVPKVNAYQSALVARLARKHVKVALSGLGGDEIFLGYTIHRYLHRLHSIQNTIPHLPALLGKISHPLISRLGIHFEEYARGFQALAALPDFRQVYAIIRNVWDSPENRKRIYGPRMLEQRFDNAFSSLEKEWDETSVDPVQCCASFELKNKMVNDLLLQEDRLSMAYGLEVRVPFLDEDLVNLVTHIPVEHRMPRGQLKGLMKETVAAWLPQSILDRPKSGFQLPIHHVFNTHLKPLTQEYLSVNRIKRDGLFNPSFVTSVLNAKPDKRLRWHYFLLYLMIGTAIWIDLFENDEPPPAWP